MSRPRRLDLIHIPIKLHEDIPNGSELQRIQECLEKNNRGENLESKKGGAIILVHNESS